MKILDLIKGKREREQETHAARQAKHWDEYRNLLARGDNATEREAERLAELAGELGFTLADVELHAIALDEHQTATATASKRSELEKSINTAQQAIDNCNQRIADIARERDQHIEAKHTAQNRLDGEIAIAEGVTQQVASYFPMVITGERFAPLITREQVINTPPTRRISQAARERGIELSIPFNEEAERKRKAQHQRNLAAAEQAEHKRMNESGGIPTISLASEQ